MTNPEAAKVLARIIDSVEPCSVLYCGSIAESVATHWCRQRPDGRLAELSLDDPAESMADGPMDLALVSDTLERLAHDAGEQLLGRLRNYGTPRIAVLVGHAPGWTFNDFIALGFRRHAELDTAAGPMTLYTYNLDTYNHERAWNNPRSWANPEMWGRGWW